MYSCVSDRISVLTHILERGYNYCTVKRCVSDRHERRCKMRYKSGEKMLEIKECVERFNMETGRYPSLSEIGERVGVVKSTVYKYLMEMTEKGMLTYDGKSGYIDTTLTRKINEESVSVAVLLGTVSCGVPKLALENICEYVRLPVSIAGHGKLFILRANGDSMINAGIANGDMVLIRQQDTAENGQIVVALTGEEATLKRYYKEKDRVRLHPENPTMKDTYPEDCVIQGIAVKVIKDI